MLEPAGGKASYYEKLLDRDLPCHGDVFRVCYYLQYVFNALGDIKQGKNHRKTKTAFSTKSLFQGCGLDKPLQLHNIFALGCLVH